jgi:AmmeMemoRadiSam system protein B
MRIREYSLPTGWYPRDPSQASEEISSFLAKFGRNGPFSRAAISPHAGWYYSGRVACRAVSSLEPDTQTIVVLGGHLPSASPILFAMEDAVKTPFGAMEIDSKLRSSLQKNFACISACDEDRFRDNTVEVLLPMVHFFFQNAALVWLRFPAENKSFEAGKIIAQTAAKLNRKVSVLASTDLTHYGRNYGFSPQGEGQTALQWMRDVNDVNFIKAVEAGNTEEVLHCAHRDSSACSAGAVLGAMGFAKEAALGSARLLEYATSVDDVVGTQIPDSFVGYAAFMFG